MEEIRKEILESIEDLSIDDPLYQRGLLMVKFLTVIDSIDDESDILVLLELANNPYNVCRANLLGWTFTTEMEEAIMEKAKELLNARYS